LLNTTSLNIYKALTYPLTFVNTNVAF